MPKMPMSYASTPSCQNAHIVVHLIKCDDHFAKVKRNFPPLGGSREYPLRRPGVNAAPRARINLLTSYHSIVYILDTLWSKGEAMTGEELRAIRDHLGWTQEQLGQALTRHKNMIARYERGELDIPELVARAAKSLGRKRPRKKNAIPVDNIHNG
jgi:Helix-turn-helix domain